MPRITAAFDIAVSSSCAESFPNVIGEAMSCAVPCVVTDVSDLAWIAGDAGRVVPPRNADGLARGMRELVEIGPAGRAALGQAARERGIKHFPLKEIGLLYEAVYAKALALPTNEIVSPASNVRHYDFRDNAAAHTPDADSQSTELSVRPISTDVYSR